MNFNELDETLARKMSNERPGKKLWSFLSQIITGNDHEDRKFKLLISRMDEYHKQEGRFKGYGYKNNKRSLRKTATQKHNSQRIARIKHATKNMKATASSGDFHSSRPAPKSDPSKENEQNQISNRQ